jgi:phosphoglycolate phosphatase
MPAFRVALFDYDGTLAATSPAVAACMSRTLRERGEPVPDAERLSAVIASGVPLEKAFAALAPHFPDDDVHWCVRRYREHYPQADSAHTTLFEGARQTVEALHDLGVAVVILSNKGRVAVEAALRRFGLADQVTAVLTADPGEPTKPHPDVFHERVARLFVGAPASDFLMIGDTSADIAFARAVGIKSCWASYGYGDHEACRALAPDYEIASIADLIAIVSPPARPAAPPSARRP